MTQNDVSGQQSHKPGGKFTQGLLDIEVILKALNTMPGQTILDAGCGDGTNTAMIVELLPNGQVIGIDASQGMLDTAVHDSHKADFRNYVIKEMVKETRQDDGRCFETFKRVNFYARK